MSRLERMRRARAPALLVLALTPAAAHVVSATAPNRAARVNVRAMSPLSSTPESPPKASVKEGVPLMGFKLTSTAFADGEAIPKKHTCDGPDLSPPLAWSGAPPGTKSFALICDDPDAPAGTWVHWVIYDLPAALSSLPEGVPADRDLKGGGRQGMNGFRRIGYGGPCPPPGKPHRYYFKLYALDAPPGLPVGASKSEVMKAAEGHVLGEAQLMGKYGR